MRGEAWLRIVQVDFNSRDEEGRVRLTLPCSTRSLAQLSPPPQEGDSVTLTDGEGFVPAVVGRVDGDWVATADWSRWVELRLVDRPVQLGQSRPVREQAA